MLNGSADVPMSDIAEDSASSSLLALDSFYDLFGETLEDETAGNASIEEGCFIIFNWLKILGDLILFLEMSYIFQEIVRLHFHYESLSMNQRSCIKILWFDSHLCEMKIATI